MIRKQLVASGLVLLALVFAGPQSALAQSKQDIEAAKKAYFEAERLFSAGQYAEALSRFEEGYRLSKRARFILNIAECHALMGQHEEAAEAYRRFLTHDARPEDRELAQARLAELEPLLAAKAAEEEAAREAAPAEEDSSATTASEPPLPRAPEPEPTPGPAATIASDGAEAEPSDAGLTSRWYFWVGIVAVVAAGVVIGITAAGADGPPFKEEGQLGSLRL